MRGLKKIAIVTARATRGIMRYRASPTLTISPRSLLSSPQRSLRSSRPDDRDWRWLAGACASDGQNNGAWLAIFL